jgi:hypothetical protein
MLDVEVRWKRISKLSTLIAYNLQYIMAVGGNVNTTFCELFCLS